MKKIIYFLITSYYWSRWKKIIIKKYISLLLLPIEADEEKNTTYQIENTTQYDLNQSWHRRSVSIRNPELIF